jgi:hypothetical protein
MNTRAAKHSGPKQVEVRRDDVNFVWIGFNDASINWQVHFRRHDFDTFKKSVEAAGEYNNFNPVLIIEAVRKIEPLVDMFRFGREGSPVLYITLNDAKNADAVIAAFRNTSVDECSVLHTICDEDFADTETTVRLWWD